MTGSIATIGYGLATIGPGIGSQIAADFPQTADALVRAARVSM